jgi:hypothetical protein
MSFSPSAEEAMVCQPETGTLFESQVTPESEEVQTRVLEFTAASFLPSADDAMECQAVLFGALVCVQVSASRRTARVQERINSRVLGFVPLGVYISGANTFGFIASFLSRVAEPDFFTTC